MQASSDYGWVFVLILFTLWFGNFGADAEQSKVYLVQCDKASEQGICQRSHAVPVVEFRAIAASQQVVALSDGLVRALAACTVFNHQNWICASDAVVQGKWTAAPTSLYYGATQTSAPWWYTKRALGWFSSGNGSSPEFNFKWSEVAATIGGFVALVAVIGAPLALYERASKRLPRLEAIVSGKAPFNEVKYLPLRVAVCAVVAITVVLIGFGLLAGVVLAFDYIDASTKGSVPAR